MTEQTIVDTDTLIDGEFGGALYEEDDRDYLAGTIIDKPDIKIEDLPLYLEPNFNATLLESQGNSVSCTAQSATNALEQGYYSKTGIRIKIDAFDQWEYQTTVYPCTASKRGDWTRSAMKALVHRTENNGGIPAIVIETGEAILVKVKGYETVARHPDDFRRWTHAGYGIVVSGNVQKCPNGKSNFAIARDEGTLRFNPKWENLGGHAFLTITGFDFRRDEPEYHHFWYGNSYGDKRGFFKNGCGKLPATEITKLHPSCWILDIEVPEEKKESPLKNRLKDQQIIWSLAEKERRISKKEGNFACEERMKEIQYNALEQKEVILEMMKEG